MRVRCDIEPVTALKTGAARLLRTVNETRRPVVITQRELREATLLLTLIAQGEADVRAGRTASQNEVFAAGRARVCKRPATSPFEPVR